MIYLIYLTSLSYQSLYALSLLTKSGLNTVVLALLFVKLLGPIELHTRHCQTGLTVQYQRSKLVKQWLSVGEGDALRDWMLELASWGWPVRVEQLRSMATELLVEKGDTKELGVHWAEQYIKWYPILKTKFVSGLDKSCAKAQDPVFINHWFELY